MSPPKLAVCDHDECPITRCRYEKEFLSERLGLPQYPDENEKFLADLAADYHRRCDNYDRAVCTGVSASGEPMPIGPHEYFRISRYARQLRKMLDDFLDIIGIPRQAFQKAVTCFHLKPQQHLTWTSPSPIARIQQAFSTGEDMPDNPGALSRCLKPFQAGDTVQRFAKVDLPSWVGTSGQVTGRKRNRSTKRTV